MKRTLRLANAARCSYTISWGEIWIHLAFFNCPSSNCCSYVLRPEGASMAGYLSANLARGRRALMKCPVLIAILLLTAVVAFANRRRPHLRQSNGRERRCDLRVRTHDHRHRYQHLDLHHDQRGRDLRHPRPASRQLSVDHRKRRLSHRRPAQPAAIRAGCGQRELHPRARCQVRNYYRSGRHCCLTN
jgi:hypothetical protein